MAAGVIGTPNSFVGSLPAAGPATAAYLSTPAGLAVDQAGDVFISDPGSDVIVKINPAGLLSIVAGTGRVGAPTPGPATESDLNDPWGLAVDSAGNLYVADIRNDVVEKITPAGALSIVAGTGRHGPPTQGLATQSDLARPVSVAIGPTGNLYIADQGNSDVEEVSPSGTLSVLAGTGSYGQPTPGAATSSRLDNPVGVAVDRRGNVYIADEYPSAMVLRVQPSHGLSVVAGMLHRAGGITPGPAANTQLGEPLAIAADSAGNLYIADTANSSVEEVTAGGVISIIAGEGVAPPPGAHQAGLNNLVNPQGIAISPGGNLYIASTMSRIVLTMTDAPNAHLSGPPTTAIGSSRVRGDAITQVLSCISGTTPCTVTATLRSAISSRHEITFARRTLTIPVGSFTGVTLEPNRVGKLLLRKLGTLRTALTINATRPTILTTAFHSLFTLKSRTR